MPRKPDVTINWVGDTIPQLQIKLQLERDWMEDGVCHQCAPDIRELFFGFGRGEDFQAACALCNICPVKSLCYAYAMIYGERGVWGGTNQSERDERRPHVVEDVVELWPRLYRKWQGEHDLREPVDEVYPAQDLEQPPPKRSRVLSDEHERARARAVEGMFVGADMGRRNPRKVGEIRRADAPEAEVPDSERA